MKNPKPTIEKLAEKYFEKTGESPEQSFWDWIASTMVEPNEKELKELLKDFNDYFTKS